MFFKVKKEIETSLEREEIIELLNNLIEKGNPTFRFWMMEGSTRKKFTGLIHENYFEISKIIGYPNSFRPLINGEIETNNKETKIKLKIQLHPISLAMVIVFGAINFIILIIGILLALSFSIIKFKILLFMFGFPTFYILLLLGGYMLFNHYSKASIRILNYHFNEKKTLHNTQ